MGCCCSKGDDDDDDNANSNNGKQPSEMELATKKANDEKLCIARGMSAPSIEVEDRIKISGHGLALAAVTIEQDSAYWEVHVIEAVADHIDIMVGLATKKDRKFYEALATNNDNNTTNTSNDDNFFSILDDEEYKKKNGLSYMSKLTVSKNDVIGIIIQQNDLPMIQFCINGQQQTHASINRFRGVVYPSLYIPPPSDHNNNDHDNNNNRSSTLKIVFQESDFQRSIPPNCSPVIVARGIV